VNVAAVPAERHFPRMDPPNVLWFFGAFTLEFAVYELIETLPSGQSGLWIFLVAIGFLAAFAVAAALLLRRAWFVPGGLAAALAVGVFPAVAVGFLKLIQVWPDDPFFQPFDEFSAYTLGVGVATALVGFVAWSLARFPFVLAVANGALLVSAQLLTPCVDESPSGDERATTALIIGAALFVIGVLIDAFGRRREAFWFEVLGLFSIAAGLVYFTADPGGDPERGWIPILVGGVALLIVAGPIRRASWAVYGVLGLYATVVHYLLKDLNQSRWPFALLLLALALLIFALGVVQHLYGEPWARRFVRRPPPSLSP
jgi:peptidoglycan/LPS O-acetylase OafA/YrhL